MTDLRLLEIFRCGVLESIETLTRQCTWYFANSTNSATDPDTSSIHRERYHHFPARSIGSSLPFDDDVRICSPQRGPSNPFDSRNLVADGAKGAYSLTGDIAISMMLGASDYQKPFIVRGRQATHLPPFPPPLNRSLSS